jgi:hypothetical protein
MALPAAARRNGALSATETLDGGNWIWMSCQRALTVANHVAIDVGVCSKNQSEYRQEREQPRHVSRHNNSTTTAR